MINLIDSLNQSDNENILVGMYQDRIPIYHVDSMHELNRLIGYAKYKNASNGTILYRGETRTHESLLPSGAREGNQPISLEVIEAIIKNDHLRGVLGLKNEEILNWSLFQQVVIESILQHYGALTYSMDFVDNHWCSLWFGLYKFKGDRYVLREDDEENMYIFLYLADTNGGNIRGLYIGEDTYVVDLRKAISSIYQRPAAQHGWIVRKKDFVEDKRYDDRLVGVLEIPVRNAKQWLGSGELTSEKNFFPSMLIDQGYGTLLEYQERSGYIKGKSRDTIIPQNTIKNYHLSNCFYCSDYNSIPSISKNVRDSDENEIKEVKDVFKLLLEKGWQQNTKYGDIQWNKYNPAIGQSLPTALLVHNILGGEISSFKISNRDHYYNIIDGIVIDLAANEVQQFYRYRNNPKTENVKTCDLRKLKNSGKNYLKNLIKNTGITIIK